MCLRKWLRAVVDSSKFNLLVAVLILLNTVLMAIDHYPIDPHFLD